MIIITIIIIIVVIMITSIISLSLSLHIYMLVYCNNLYICIYRAERRTLLDLLRIGSPRGPEASELLPCHIYIYIYIYVYIHISLFILLLLLSLLIVLSLVLRRGISLFLVGWSEDVILGHIVEATLWLNVVVSRLLRHFLV